MFSYWEHNRHIEDYFVFHLCVAALSEQSELKDAFEQIPFYSNTYPQLLGMELAKPYAEEKIEYILKKTNIHKLTYKGLDGLGEDTFYRHLLNDNI
jgi:hypothetical protein